MFENFLFFKAGEWTRQKEQEDCAEKREEIGKGNQMTALRFQTGGGGPQTSPASFQGKCWVLSSVWCSLIHCWQFWPYFFSVCTVRCELFFLHEINKTKNSWHWLDFETLHVNTVHPPHNLSSHAIVHAFPAFPTLKTSVLPVFAISHDHHLWLAVLQFYCWLF